MDNLAIKADNISKMYKLYDKPIERLKESLGISKKKCYQEHFALHNLNFHITKGETVGIIGSNGSGKSTILKIITGVLNQSEGEIAVDGRISSLLELGAGFNMEYTGIQNIFLNGTMIGFSKKEIENRLDVIIEFADIGEFIYQPVKTYSSGMFVRLAFAVAINIDPEILIIDEALSVGDMFFQAKCYRKFEDFKKIGKTILLVSHDLGSISKYCDRVILLNKGEKLGEGSPKEIIDLYKRVLVNQLENPSEKTTDIGDIVIDTLWKNALIINPNTIEYGDKQAYIIDYCLEDEKGMITNNIIKGNKFVIRMKVRIDSQLQEPIYAFTIKDLKGTEIAGTNTLIEKANTGNPQKGSCMEISFTQTMNLQGGSYLLSLGCTGYQSGEFKVFHRLYDICGINVISDKNSVGYYDMNSEIVVR